MMQCIYMWLIRSNTLLCGLKNKHLASMLFNLKLYNFHSIVEFSLRIETDISMVLEMLTKKLKLRN